MKIMKRLLALSLSLLLAVTFFGCDTTQQKIEALTGVYTATVADTEEQAKMLVENVDFYEEEIALLDMTSLECVKLVEFQADKTYRFSFDVDGTMECVRDFYLRAFENLYEGRTALNAVYSDWGVTFDDMTNDEFQAFYAELYEQTDFEALIDAFVETSYDTDKLGEDTETGTYDIVGNRIMCTIDGETEAEGMLYNLSGDSLKLTYSNAVENYTRKP